MFDLEGDLGGRLGNCATLSNSNNNVALDLKLVTYLVEIRTSKRLRGGTDAVVYVYLYGDKGVSGK